MKPFATIALCLIATAAFSATVTVTVGPGLSFSPSSVNINTGDTVQWNWAPFSLPHTTSSNTTVGPEVWDSGTRSSGSFSHTFTNAGNWGYYCKLHSFPAGTAMNGVVHVTVPTPPPTITNVAPATSAPGLPVTITGTGFISGATVTFAGTPGAVTFVNSTTLTVTVPSIPPGPAAVVVTNPDTQSATFNGFTVLPASAIPLLDPRALWILAAVLAAIGAIKLSVR